MSFNKVLRDAAEELGFKLTQNELSKFRAYYDLLTEWNERLNLTAITEEKEVIVKHFIDSLTVASFITDNSEVLDIGSGGGFPGVPLMILNSTLSLSLIESVGRKVTFLKELKRALELDNVDIFHVRAEEARADLTGKFDYVLFRAFGSFEKISIISKPYLCVKGRVIVMKGPGGAEEYEEFANSTDINFRLIESREFKLPLNGGDRSIFNLEYF